MTFDVAVVGSGIMGTAVALELGRRGRSVGVFDRFQAGHVRGSSHGPTRIFRLSYDRPEYAELALQASKDWRRLERDAGVRLLDPVGGVDLGPGAHACAEGMERAGVEFEELSPAEVDERFGLVADEPAVFQPDASVIDAAAAWEAQRRLASQTGVQFHDGTRVTGLDIDEDVTVSSGDQSWKARAIVVCAGPWAGPFAETFGLDVSFVVTREQVTYLEGVGDRTPIVIDWTDPATYLVPGRFSASGARVGIHHAGEPVDPEDGPFEASEEVSDKARVWADRIGGTPTKVIGTETCLYTNAPDEDLVLRDLGRVVFLSACSGHGFKFAPRMGRVVADVIDTGEAPDLPERLRDMWLPAGAGREPRL